MLSDGIGIAVIEALPGRTFAQEDHYLAGSSIASFNVSDVNGDGYPDLVAADIKGTTVAVLLNQPNGIPPGGLHLAATLAVAPEPAAYGQPANATLSVAQPANGPAPTGMVSFSIDSSLLSTVPLTNGSASVQLGTGLSAGSRLVTAAYNGDGNYAAATFTERHTVNIPVYTSTTTLTATPAAALASQTVRMLATVTTTGKYDVGIVTFYDGTMVVGSATIDPFHHALLDTALLQPGTHSLSAVYAGETDTDPFNPGAYQPSTSAAVDVVISATPTITGLSASLSSPTAGSVVTFTAFVSSTPGVTSGAPFGGVSFFDGPALLGTSSLAPASGGAKASFSTGSLGAGQHTINASYNANANFGGSTSSQGLQVVQAAASLAPSLTRLVLSGKSNAATTLTATVLTANGSPPRPLHGVVTLLDGGLLLGTSNVAADGSASLSLPTLSAGTHTLRASFGGASSLAPSISPALTQQLTKSALSLTPGAGAVTLGSTAAAHVSLGVTGGVAAGSAVTLSCGNAAEAGLLCSFAPATVQGSASTVLTITPAAISRSGAQLPGRRSGPRSETPSEPWSAGLISLAAVLCCFGRQRKSLGLLLCALAAVGTAVIGCGSQTTTPQTPPHTPGATVLVVQASSSTDAGAIVGSTQLVVIRH